MDWITLGTEMTCTMCCGGILTLALLALLVLHITQTKPSERGIRWDDPTETFAKFVERNRDVFYEE